MKELMKLRSLVVSDLRSETKGSRSESVCWLCAEVSSLWKRVEVVVRS